MDTLIILLANYLLYAVGLAALAAWLLMPRGDRVRLALSMILAAAAVLICVKFAGAIWTDPRPFVVDGRPPLVAQPADNGFPSDHATLAAAVSGVVASQRRYLGAVLLGLSALLGTARVLAHLHHVPDVIGGLLLGLLCAGAAVTGVARLGRRTEQRR